MGEIARFSHAQRVIVRVAQHRVCHDDHVAGSIGYGGGLSLANGEDLVFNRPRRRCLIHALKTFMTQVGKHSLEQGEAPWRIGGQPDVHAPNNAPKALEVAIDCVGDIEES